MNVSFLLLTRKMGDLNKNVGPEVELGDVADWRGRRTKLVFAPWSVS